MFSLTELSDIFGLTELSEVFDPEAGLPRAGPHTALCSILSYRVTSLLRKRHSVGPYRRPMHRVPGGSWGDGCFLGTPVSGE